MYISTNHNDYYKINMYMVDEKCASCLAANVKIIIGIGLFVSRTSLVGSLIRFTLCLSIIAICVYLDISTPTLVVWTFLALPFDSSTNTITKMKYGRLYRQPCQSVRSTRRSWYPQTMRPPRLSPYRFRARRLRRGPRTTGSRYPRRIRPKK